MPSSSAPSRQTGPSAPTDEPTQESVPYEDLEAEFDRQIGVLLAKGYPSAAGLSREQFLELLEPLRSSAAATAASAPERIPFVVVVASTLVRTAHGIAAVEVSGRQGWTDETAEDHARFTPIEPVALPEAPVYIVEDVDTGAATLGWTPNDALPLVLDQGRTPLTIDEGLALITQFPQILATHNAYQLMGSRCGDKRVPAVWMSKGAPRLGWCWAGNHHTWLGMASAGHRRT